MRLRRNNSLVSFIISQSHIKWEVFLYYFFTRQSWRGLRDFAFSIYKYTNAYLGYKLTLITYLIMEN